MNCIYVTVSFEAFFKFFLYWLSFFSFSWSYLFDPSSLSCEFFTFKKSIEVLLKILSRGWMSNKDYSSFSINKHDMRNSLNSISRTAFRFMPMIMFDTTPFLFLDMTFHSIFGFVNADTDDSDFSTPVSSSFLKHFLIMRHWFLAWWAPSSPEIYQNDITFIMDDTAFFVLINWHNIFDSLVHVTCSHLR